MAEQKEFVLIGAGIMSATLGILIKEVMPDAQIDIYERLDLVAAESSDGWNNAGTGHSAFCELNYTPYNEDGTLNIEKAKRIAESFEISKQFWAYLLQNEKLDPEKTFINDIDHMSFVWGADNIRFLKDRYESMTKYALFEDMKFSQDHSQIKEWIPLMMNGRDPNEEVAVTRMEIGTDVNFGSITRGMIQYLQSCDGVNVHLGHEVDDLEKMPDGQWRIEVTDLDLKEEKVVIANKVFIGAGGGALILLEKSDIPEGRGFGGFPVSGQFLKCNNPEVIAQHEAKVYGKAATGSPPMSVPHLDTRMLGEERSLLFGPYAGFSTKFLKEGSYMDLFISIEAHNVWPMLSAGAQNLDLTKYLIEQVMQSDKDRFESLQEYYPEAKFEDWERIIAGQRVQIIKKDEEKGGKLQFGTEIVSSADGSLVALLGASPGASTAVSIMLNVLDKCYPDHQWQSALQRIIPSYGKSLLEDGALCRATRKRTTEILGLDPNRLTP